MCLTWLRQPSLRLRASRRPAVLPPRSQVTQSTAARSSYLSLGTFWASFDTPSSMFSKIQGAASLNLGGLMVGGCWVVGGLGGQVAASGDRRCARCGSKQVWNACPPCLRPACLDRPLTHAFAACACTNCYRCGRPTWMTLLSPCCGCYATARTPTSGRPRPRRLRARHPGGLHRRSVRARRPGARHRRPAARRRSRPGGRCRPRCCVGHHRLHRHAGRLHGAHRLLPRLLLLLARHLRWPAAPPAQPPSLWGS